MKPYENFENFEKYANNYAAIGNPTQPATALDAAHSAFDSTTSLVNRVCSFADMACGALPQATGEGPASKDVTGALNHLGDRAEWTKSRVAAGHDAMVRLERAFGLY